MALLVERPEGVFVGTWGRDFVVEDGAEKPLGAWQALPDPALLKAYLLFNNPIPAPSVLVHRETLNERGLRFRGRAEDYDLWARLAEFADLHVVPEELVRIRQHGGRLTELNPGGTLTDADDVRRRLLEGLGVPFGEEELRLHCFLGKGGTPHLAQLEAVRRWLHKLSLASQRLPEREGHALRTVVGMRWLSVCQTTPGSRWQKFARWLRADVARTSLSPRHYRRALAALGRS
jgi:hypothetical protein